MLHRKNADSAEVAPVKMQRLFAVRNVVTGDGKRGPAWQSALRIAVMNVSGMVIQSHTTYYTRCFFVCREESFDAPVKICYSMNMETDKKQQFIQTVLFAVCIGLIIYVAFRYALPILSPFLIAFIVTALVTPAVDFFHRKLHIPKKLSAIVLVTLAYLVLAGIFILVGIGVYRWAMNADGWVQTVFIPEALSIFERLSTLLDEFASDLVPFLASVRDNLITVIGSKVSTVSAELISGAASSLPGFAIGIIFAVVATYFMATDTDRIRHFIATRQTESFYTKVSAAYLSLKKTVGKYLRAYFFIFLITFAELTVGFLCAGVSNFALIALLVAVFDILPILGSSMILLPWSVILLLTGDYRRGAVMFAVYLIVVIVRQLTEPKIVGEHVGLHPLITLIAMYVGGKLFGGVGILGFPICCAVIVQLQNAGFLNLFPQRRGPVIVQTPKQSENIFSKTVKK